MVLPDLEQAEYIVQHWHHAGTVSQGGMGISPLSWTELRSWRLENDLDLKPYEVGLIRFLSVEYVSEYHAASDKNRESPYIVAEEEIDRPAIANKLFNVLMSYKRSTPDDDKYEIE